MGLGCSRNVILYWPLVTGRRETFVPTMMLTLGADLYTVSKLLGHANVKTTQIYAKIIDSKKTEAVNLMDKVFD